MLSLPLVKEQIAQRILIVNPDEVPINTKRTEEERPTTQR
jgi:hypothetical protein